MTITGKHLFIWILIITCLLPSTKLFAQSKKKSKITDALGLIAGTNIVLYSPYDVNNNAVHSGNPELKPGWMAGMSYYHAFNARWAHTFQFRMADHQMKYWKADSRAGYYLNNHWTVNSDSGDYHLKYQDVSFAYLFGWSVSKKFDWHFYSGLQISYTFNNQSVKNVDRIEYGFWKGGEYILHPQPLYFYDETHNTYSQDAWAELLFRTDTKIKLSENWTIRPALEFGLDLGRSQVLIEDRLAFYVEVYRAL